MSCSYKIQLNNKMEKKNKFFTFQLILSSSKRICRQIAIPHGTRDSTVSVVSIKKQLKNKKTVFFKLDISKTKRNLEKWYSSFSSYFCEYYKNLSPDRGAMVTVELPKNHFKY